MTFLEKLELLMADRGINKSTLAKETGIPLSTISSLWTQGHENIRLKTLKSLVNYFGCDYEFLIGDDDTVRPKIENQEDIMEFMHLYRDASPVARQIADLAVGRKAPKIDPPRKDT